MPVTMKSKQVQEEKPVGKTSHTVKAKAGAVVTEAQAMVDEAVQIHQKMEELEVSAMQKRLDAIKKHFSGLGKSLPENEVAVFKGTKGELEFTKCAQELEITDKDKLIKMLTQKVFNDIAKLSVTEMRKYLSQNEIDGVSTTVAGSRRLSSIRAYD